MKEALILSDSMTKDFPDFKNHDVVTISGATIPKIIEHVMENCHNFNNYRVIVLHVGTNHFSDRSEWQLYKNYVNRRLSKESYNQILREMNPPPALGTAIKFRDKYQNLIDLVKQSTTAKILISAVLPRWWDKDRRHLVRKVYNEILRKMGDGHRVYFSASYRPFFDNNRNLKAELFKWDGLHLSEMGTTVFSTYICDRIRRCIRGELK